MTRNIQVAPPKLNSKNCCFTWWRKNKDPFLFLGPVFRRFALNIHCIYVKWCMLNFTVSFLTCANFDYDPPGTRWLIAPQSSYRESSANSDGFPAKWLVTGESTKSSSRGHTVPNHFRIIQWTSGQPFRSLVKLSRFAGRYSNQQTSRCIIFSENSNSHGRLPTKNWNFVGGCSQFGCFTT